MSNADPTMASLLSTIQDLHKRVMDLEAAVTTGPQHSPGGRSRTAAQGSAENKGLSRAGLLKAAAVGAAAVAGAGVLDGRAPQITRADNPPQEVVGTDVQAVGGNPNIDIGFVAEVEDSNGIPVYTYGMKAEGAAAGVWGTVIEGGGFTPSAGVYGYSQRWEGLTGVAGSYPGVLGSSGSGPGVEGRSQSGAGVWGDSHSSDGVSGSSADATHSGVYGNNTADGYGVYGRSGNGQGVHGESTGGQGVLGNSTNGTGVEGDSVNSDGVYGQSTWRIGVLGSSENSYGVYGQSRGLNASGIVGAVFDSEGRPAAGNGVKGMAATVGVFGTSVDATAQDGTGGGDGVMGSSRRGQGVHGVSDSGFGVLGTSTQGRGGAFASPIAQLYLVPAFHSGHPNSGAHFKGDLYLDRRAQLFICTSAGTPGTWVRVNVTPV